MSYRNHYFKLLLRLSSLAGSLVSPFAGGVAKADTAPSQPVELPTYETAYSKVYANPDGTLSANLYFAPVNYTDGQGNSKSIDTTVVPDGSGGYGVTNNLF